MQERQLFELEAHHCNARHVSARPMRLCTRPSLMGPLMFATIGIIADALIVLRHFVAGYVNYIDVSLRSFASIISRSDLRMSLPAGEMGNSDRISIRSGSLNRAMF